MGYKINNKSKHPSTKRKVICIVLGLSFLVTAVVLWMVEPMNLIIKHIMRVDYGTKIHAALSEENVGVRVHTYLFNISNAQRFQDGLDSKLRVHEVGPFTYQERRKNEFLEIDLENDVMQYSPRIRAEFLPEESIGRPEDVSVTMPNVAMLSLASKAGTYSMVPRLGFNLLTSKLKTKPIVQVTAHDYLWGFEEPLIKLGNDLMPGLVKFDKLGLLDRLYDQDTRFLLQVSANDADKFAIRSVNQSQGLDLWGYQDLETRSSCNTFTDVYEGIAYPPDLTPDRNLRLYRNTFCRILQLDYQGTKQSYGVEAFKFAISNRTYTTNSETKCLCANDICQDGISDMSPCFMGLPVVLSHAHFLYADPSVYEKIEGLEPDEKRHGSSFVIEPKLGMALESSFTVQVSLYIRNTHFNPATSPFADTVIPIIYFRIVQPELKDQQITVVRMFRVIGPAVFLAIEILCLLLGLGLLAYSAAMVYVQWTSDRREVQGYKVRPGVEVPLVS